MKNVIPFSNGTEAEQWMSSNCEICKTKCHFKRNMEFGFIIGVITVKTAEFIGFKYMNETFVSLYSKCKNKDKYEPEKRIKNDNSLKLF